MDSFNIFVWTLLFYTLSNFSVSESSDLRTNRQHKLEQLLRTLRNYSAPHREKHPTRTTTATTTTRMSIEPQTTTPSISQSTTENPIPITGDSKKNFYKLYFPEEGKNSQLIHESSDIKRSRFSGDDISNTIDAGDFMKAHEHYTHIRREHKCKVPVPKLMKVKEFYTDSSRSYRPRCVSLHRCGDESGCCDNDGLHCVASQVQAVALHFISWSIRGSLKESPTTVKLWFVNHTACHCEPINDVPRIGGEPLDEVASNKDQTSSPPSPQSSEKCQDCPVPFTRRTYRDGRCGCDCFDKEKICLKIKRGRQQLAEVERSCIQANFCSVPDCEHGAFDVKTGFCPRGPDVALQRPQHRIRHKTSSNPRANRKSKLTHQ